MGLIIIKEQTLTPILFLKHSFHTLSLSLLTLLLPLSFLLLSRLAYSPPSPQLSSTILRALVSIITFSSLIHSLSGRKLNLPLSLAWPFLFLFQLCVTLGIESTISESTSTTTRSSIWIERAVFFLGMYEIMLHWSRMIVRSVVDDTIFGVVMEERRVGRLAIGVAFGLLWVWVLRDEVEPLLAVAGTEGLMAAMRGWGEFVMWFVSYTTVVIGVVRVVEVVVLVGKVVFLFLCWGCREVEDRVSSHVCIIGDDQV